MDFVTIGTSEVLRSDINIVMRVKQLNPNYLIDLDLDGKVIPKKTGTLEIVGSTRIYLFSRINSTTEYIDFKATDEEHALFLKELKSNGSKELPSSEGQLLLETVDQDIDQKGEIE